MDKELPYVVTPKKLKDGDFKTLEDIKDCF
jgi:hypothetical protein